MNLEETKKYIERRLGDLGWSVRIDRNGFQTIQKYSGGDKERLNHLYYKMVSVGSRQEKREINGETIQVAIEDLKRMDEIVENAPLNLGQNNRHDFDRVTIEQLASSLEEKVAAEIESAVAQAGKPVSEPAARETKSGGNGQHHPAGAATAAAAFPSKDGAVRKPRILVVDDSPTIRAAVTKALENDFEFVEASDGERAWKLLRANTDVKLVVTDLMMPKVDGYDLIKRIRTNKTDPWIANLPIIVCTALEDTQAKLRALVAGANDFITKNTDTLELQARVMARYQLAQAVNSERNNNPALVPPSTDVGPPSRQTAATLLGHKAGPTIAKQAIKLESVGKPLGANPSKTSAAVTSIQIPPRTSGPHPVSVERNGDDNLLDRVVATAVAGYRRLEQLDPTTGITLLASFLVVVTIAGVLYVNRSAPRTAAAVDAPSRVASSDETSEQSAAAGGVATNGKLTAGERETTAVDVVQNGTSSTPVDRTWEHEKLSATSGQTTKRELPKPAKAVPVAAAEPTPKPATPPETPKAAVAAASTGKTVETPEPPSVTAARQASSETETAASSAGISPPSTSGETQSRPVEAPVVVAQARPTIASNRLTQSELNALVKKFVFVYQAGDIESFLSLFDDSIRTNDRSSKAGLREDYEALFKSTTLRQMVVGDVAWDVDDRQARGWSNFEVRVRNQGEDELKVYRGSLTFHVEKVDGRPKIVRLFHGQWKAAN